MHNYALVWTRFRAIRRNMETDPPHPGPRTGGGGCSVFSIIFRFLLVEFLIVWYDDRPMMYFLSPYLLYFLSSYLLYIFFHQILLLLILVQNIPIFRFCGNFALCPHVPHASLSTFFDNDLTHINFSIFRFPFVIKIYNHLKCIYIGMCLLYNISDKFLPL